MVFCWVFPTTPPTLPTPCCVPMPAAPTDAAAGVAVVAVDTPTGPTTPPVLVAVAAPTDFWPPCGAPVVVEEGTPIPRGKGVWREGVLVHFALVGESKGQNKRYGEKGLKCYVVW